MIVLPVGDDAVLLEFESRDAVERIVVGLRGQCIEGIEEIVPGARTLLLVGPRAQALADELRDREFPLPDADQERVITIPVIYDGPDLHTVAQLCGTSDNGVVARHLATRYRVAFCGFSPGFAYLTGHAPNLHVPRLASPRTTVPAGSVALAGEFCGVYPRESPGGWQIIGRTKIDLWNLAWTPPALLQPGACVRFMVERDP